MLDLQHSVKALVCIIVCTVFGTGTLVAFVSSSDLDPILVSILSIVPIILVVTSIFMAISFVKAEE